MTPTDPGIAALVDEIPAIDDHAHPNPPSWEPSPDRANPIQPYDHELPVRQRPTNPEYIRVWQELWGYRYDDVEPVHLAELIDSKQAAQEAAGDAYASGVLDRLNIETMLAVGWGPEASLPAPRFRWLTFADWLMWPVPAATQRDAGVTGGYAAQIDGALSRAGLDTMPSSLDGYVSTVLGPELEQRQADGAVGLKFQTPYYRSIDFAEIDHEEADQLYRQGLQAPLPELAHRRLEDYLFHEIAAKAGSLGMPVQMHTGHGMKPEFRELGSNPLLMESAVIAAPQARFLILHAGWPYDQEAISALTHRNVYMDISAQTAHLYPRRLAQIIRDGLEWFPEKVLFGTDAYSEIAVAYLSGTRPKPNFLHGWEEKAYLFNRTARDALALALTEMRQDGVVSTDDVQRLANRVLRDNALNLYRLETDAS